MPFQNLALGILDCVHITVLGLPVMLMLEIGENPSLVWNNKSRLFHPLKQVILSLAGTCTSCFWRGEGGVTSQLFAGLTPHSYSFTMGHFSVTVYLCKHWEFMQTPQKKACPCLAWGSIKPVTLLWSRSALPLCTTDYKIQYSMYQDYRLLWFTLFYALLDRKNAFVAF